MNLQYVVRMRMHKVYTVICYIQTTLEMYWSLQFKTTVFSLYFEATRL